MGPADLRDGPAWDPGLARERTQLAWTRTTMSLIALGTAIVRAAPLPGLAILAMGAFTWVVSHRLGGSHPYGGERRRRRPLKAIAIAITLVSLAALVTTVLVPGARTARSPLLPAPAPAPAGPAAPPPVR
ncbi:DUF202 domain-containing protein [Nonomuraea candida]|uniref:DUF202 domain-containing protein n=1 Tax=Nonomuraea candida TaxID=359159 RepID=UPI0005B88D37|nr:DUF202 domain-containing protein [Nonomuraea candida]